MNISKWNSSKPKIEECKLFIQGSDNPIIYKGDNCIKEAVTDNQNLYNNTAIIEVRIV